MSKPRNCRPRGLRNLTKPCHCKRDGCVVVQHEREKPSGFEARKYASRSCASWTSNRSDQRKPPLRTKSRTPKNGARSDGRVSCEIAAGALVTHSAWLYRPSGRIQAQRLAEGLVP